MTPLDRDIVFMQQAIDLGKQAKGTTGDNPYVGCLVVLHEEIIGKGSTQPPGGPHAEIAALNDAESRNLSVTGATVYTTVEPCSFYGRTPACALTLIEKKIVRVVIGIRDPHPRVNGKGIELLRSAKIEVIEDICGDVVRDYLSDWLKSHSSP